MPIAGERIALVPKGRKRLLQAVSRWKGREGWNGEAQKEQTNKQKRTIFIEQVATTFGVVSGFHYTTCRCYVHAMWSAEFIFWRKVAQCLTEPRCRIRLYLIQSLCLHTAQKMRDLQGNSVCRGDNNTNYTTILLHPCSNSYKNIYIHIRCYLHFKAPTPTKAMLNVDSRSHFSNYRRKFFFFFK